jgi:hypothetical protein
MQLLVLLLVLLVLLFIPSVASGTLALRNILRVNDAGRRNAPFSAVSISTGRLSTPLRASTIGGPSLTNRKFRASPAGLWIVTKRYPDRSIYMAARPDASLFGI